MPETSELVPLYAFTQGDAIGILILAMSLDTIADVINKVANAIQVRVAPQLHWQLVYQEKIVPTHLTVKAAGIQALTRIDLVHEAS